MSEPGGGGGGGGNKWGNLGMWIISMQLCMHKPLAKNLMKVTLE